MRHVRTLLMSAVCLAMALSATACGDDDTTTCTPDCVGAECGDDGCGGSCGTCTGGMTCDSNRQCTGTCTPECTGRECGDDGCGGSCGTCPTGESCDTAGQCQACAPDCAGRECGDDGCGGSCGTCPTGETCDTDGLCQGCTPDCTGRECGDDGCGGSCGSCPTGQTCDTAGQCHACQPDCTGKVCGDDGCGGSCGTCSGTDLCVSGQCVCQPDCAGKVCGDDGCGGSCGSCPTGEICNASGQCVTSCTPSCTGKACGNDGCGGSCGTCSGQDVCVNYQCVCQPDCVGKACGDDGCGGSCGTCTGQDTCVNNQCVCQPSCTGKVCGDDGCGGSCGTCPSGEWCVSGACHECTTGQIQCVSGDVTVERECIAGQWVQQACPSEHLCAQDSCRLVCDGLLSTTSYPTVCFMPHSETGQILWYSNDPSLLSGSSHAGVLVVNGSNPAPMYTDTSLTWPSYWSLNGLQGSGCISYRLNQFTSGFSQVTFGASIKRTGIISYLTNWLIAFFNALNTNLGTASGLVGYTYAQQFIWLDPSMNSQLHTNGSYNNACIGITGDGNGHPADLVDMNYMLLEIQY